ncbi:MAG: hypothetical protein GY822_32635 [Deltaproteobacteria bacterium]|nr:hypothetical protein [Deltaproteobacteria bacterium]
MFEQSKGFVEALKWYDEAIELEPKYVDAMANAVALSHDLGRPRDARRYAKLAADCGDSSVLKYLDMKRR